MRSKDLDRSEGAELEKRVERYNEKAMELSKKGQGGEAARWLKKANEILTNLTPVERVIRLKAETLNNLGCVYKRNGEAEQALHFFNQALGYEQRVTDKEGMAGTHLKLGAVKARMGQFNQALAHAQTAIRILKAEERKDKKTMATAYKHAGVQYLNLGKETKARKYLKKAYALALFECGQNHALTQSVQEYLNKTEGNRKGFDAYGEMRYGKHIFVDEPSDLVRFQTEFKIFSEKTKKSSEELARKRSLEPISNAKTPKSYWQGLETIAEQNQPLRRMSQIPMNAKSLSTVKKAKCKPRSFDPHFKQDEASSKFDQLSKKLFSRAPNSPLQSPHQIKLTHILKKVDFLQTKLSSIEEKYNKFAHSHLESTPKSFSNKKFNASTFLKKNDQNSIVKERVQKTIKQMKTRSKLTLITTNKYDKEKAWEHSKKIAVRDLNKTNWIQEIDQILEEVLSAEKDSEFLKGIIAIQAYIRGYIMRRILEKRIYAAIKIQRAVRKYRIRRIYKKILLATTFIQAVYRGYRARKYANECNGIVAWFQSKKQWCK